MFRFKQFSVDQTGCAMKINTDGVLLGALVEALNPITVLDIGTGTGVIGLMLAQRFMDAKIDAVEIEASAAETARRNFADSPFQDRLAVYPVGFEKYFENYTDRMYDLIISNPPFYINSLISPEAGKKLAKHADDNFFEKLITTVAGHLKQDGTCWLVLPPETAVLVQENMSGQNLYLNKVISIQSYPSSEPHRRLIKISRIKTPVIYESFVIYASLKVYSTQYEQALRHFFTIFD